MEWLRGHWQYLAVIFFIGLAFYMGFWGGAELPVLQRFMVMSLMALFAHQAEEYLLPGGAPLVINRGTYGEKQNYRQYPGNTQSSMLVNLLAWGLYLIGVFLYQAVWLGIGLMFFNLMQFLGHVLAMNRALKTWYNPGMATTICLLTPISAAYFAYVVQNNLATGLDWILGIGTFIASVVLTTVLPVQLLKSPNSPYQISEWQVRQYEKVIQFAALRKDKKE